MALSLCAHNRFIPINFKYNAQGTELLHSRETIVKSRGRELVLRKLKQEQTGKQARVIGIASQPLTPADLFHSNAALESPT
jgi:hypothetical protein